MLRWYKERYDNGREIIKSDKVISILTKALQDNNINLTEQECNKVLLIMLSELSVYFAHNIERVIDMGNTVIYKDSDLDNLLVLQRKEPKTASAIRKELHEVILPTMEMKSVVKGYVENMSSSAIQDEQKIKQLEEVLNQRKGEV